MRVLVTGATGYLGRVVVARCIEQGHEVHALWHTQPPRLQTDGGAGAPLATWHRSDLADGPSIRPLLERVEPDLVIHTAYGTAATHESVTAAAPGEIAAAAHTGARLIHLSTDVVFDGDRQEGGYDEDDPTHPITDYGRAKERAERLVMAARPDALILRTSLIYGGAEPGPQEDLVRRALDGEPGIAFFTDEIRSVVHVDDLAAAIVELADQDGSGVLHVAGADAVSRLELARLLARSWGRPEGLPSAVSEGLQPPRPRNCTLDSTRAQTRLRTRLRGIREVLAAG